MPLDHYVTLGRSGLRVSPLCLGAMTFGEDLGWGSSVEESQQIIDRYHRARRQLHRHRELLHQEPLREDHRRPRRPPRGPARPARHRHQVQRQPLPRRSRTAAARAASRSSPPARSRCAACRPTTSISTGCTTGTCTRRSTRRWPRSTISCAPARCATSASPTRPAWKVAEANVTARFRGWSPFIGLQIEYSLLERTVEQELVPMARELGLGITPWSPLKSGVLSGKYTRENAGQVEGRPRRLPRALPQREDLRARRRARGHRQGARHHGRARRARLGAGAARRDVDDHRRAPARAARGQREGARRARSRPRSSRGSTRSPSRRSASRRACSRCSRPSTTAAPR